MRLRDGQGIPECNLRKIGIPKHKPAIPEEPVGISVEKGSKRTRIACTQHRCQLRGTRLLGVTHTQKLEQRRAHSYPFKLTGGY
jgi:hypothetical protein